MITFISPGRTIINIQASGITDPGRARSHNEDSFFIHQNLGIFMVADGMGGHSGGDIASDIFRSTTIDVFVNQEDNNAETDEERIKRCFNRAHLEILDRVKRAPHLKGMGCTANLLRIQDDAITLGHTGDSRTYLLRAKQLEQLTTDHSFVQQQIDLGLLSPEQAKHHKLRNIILQAVGVTESLQVDIITREILPNDVILLCTDGLYTMLEDETIKEILSSEMTPAQKAGVLVNLANGAGGKDNVTVIIIAITS